MFERTQPGQQPGFNQARSGFADMNQGLESIPKRTAAAEILNELKKDRFVCITMVIGAMFVYAGSVINQWLGGLAAILLVALAGIRLYQVVKKTEYLKTKYRIS